MESIKQPVIHGMLLGMVAGLTATLLDGALMLVLRVYIPPSYPVVLILFNVVFWTCVGCIAGVLVKLFGSPEPGIRRLPLRNVLDNLFPYPF